MRDEVGHGLHLHSHGLTGLLEEANMNIRLVSGALFASVVFGCAPTSSGGASEETFELGAGVVVATMELAAPSSETFILHGTMPVPPGLFPSSDGSVPFAVVDHDGTLLSAQVETVSRYARDGDGADVVEIIAEVHRPPGVSPGDRIVYVVQHAPHPAKSSAAPPEQPSDITPAAFTATIPQTLEELINDSGSIRITSTDVFGNEYEAYPLADWPQSNPRIQRWGEYQLQLGTYDTMLPTAPVSGFQGTLPHSFGVHSYMSVRKASGTLQFDIRFNNGADGNDKGTTRDDPLGKMYFDSVHVELPRGWVMMQDVQNPGMGTPIDLGARLAYPLVAENPDGSVHMMPSQGQFHRRLVIVKEGGEEAGRRILDQEGLAFCVPEIGAQNGGENYSWQREDLGRYFPQAHALPSLEYMGLDVVRAELKGELDEMRGHLQAGTDSGAYPVESPRLGWAHPSGSGYGGMTGGVDINLFDGVRTAAAASVDGYLHLTDRFRMANDRMPVALYSKTGQPSRVADWLEGSGDLAYVPFTAYNGKMNGSSDPFGYNVSPAFQRDYVDAQGLGPDYEEALDYYKAHDRQHMIRYTGAVKALAWLGNDWLAKDALKMVSESFHMEYHQYFNSGSQSVQGTGLLAEMNYVKDAPGIGFGIGRGEGWGLDATSAAYALTSDDTWREQTREWLDLVVDNVFDGQADCSGIIESKTSKWLDGKYRVRSSIEMSILESGLRSMAVRVYKSVDFGRHAMLQDVLHDSYYGMISDLSWAPGNAGPWSHLAVAPLDTETQVPFCSGAELPSDGHDQYLENYQCWSSLAYGFELTGNSTFLDHARLMTSGGSLTASLQAQGTSNLGNRAALLALAQKIGD